MKLISEHIDIPVEYMTENVEGEKRHYIEGVFMQAEGKNRNGRVYPKSVLEAAVEKYVDEQVKGGRAVGELDHPEGPMINLNKVSHRIVDLQWEGNDVIGKALVLNTHHGKDLKGMLEGGVQLGVSSRGMGSLTRNEGVDVVANDYILNTVDVVQDPSAHSAFVNGIMESVDWFKGKDGLFHAVRHGEKAETELKESVDEIKLRMLRKFLSGQSY